MTGATERMEGATKRVNRGNNHSYLLDGTKASGVTTVLGDGVPKPALVGWAARTIAEFVAERLEIDADTGAVRADEMVKALAKIDADSKYPKFPKDGTVSRLGIIEVLKGLHWNERDRAARRGTEVHGYAEQIINGTEVDVPDELLGHVDSYLKFLDDFSPQPVLVEFVIGHRAHGWMGTGDLIADLNDGLRWLLDIKTARSGIYPETALQLSAYKAAEFYLDTAGVEHPMIPVDRVGAIWVRADGYDLIPVDAGAATYKVFRHVQQVARWQKETGEHAVLPAITPLEWTA